MNREEAIKLFKEIIAKCEINLLAVSLVPPRKDDALSSGYQLHIKSFLCSYDRDLMQAIIDGHQLTWQEIGGNIIIYKLQTDLSSNC